MGRRKKIIQNSLGKKTVDVINNIPFDKKTALIFNKAKTKNILGNQKLKIMQEEKQPFQLRILLSALIDSELIKEKIKLNLKENTFEKKYYLLNFDWFKEYIEQNNMSEIYNNIVNNHSIELVLKSEIEENKEENNLIIEQVIQDSNKDLNKAISKKNNFFERNDKLSYNVEPNYITDGNDGYLFYYYNNFLLLSEYTKNLL